MKDWADKIGLNIGGPLRANTIAAALRKAKADGMRRAAEITSSQTDQRDSESVAARVHNIAYLLREEAYKIEKGKP